MNAKDALGQLGEEAAARYLTRSGWTILDRNWRCSEGELDIVASDGSELIVCEVKTRSSVSHGTPAEAVTEAKAARLRRLAYRWLAEHQRSGPVRIDVIGLLADGPDRFTVDHLKGVC